MQISPALRLAPIGYFNQIDIRGWAHRLSDEDGKNIVNIGRGSYILTILTPPLGIPDSTKDEL